MSSLISSGLFPILLLASPDLRSFRGSFRPPFKETRLSSLSLPRLQQPALFSLPRPPRQLLPDSIASQLGTLYFSRMPVSSRHSPHLHTTASQRVHAQIDQICLHEMEYSDTDDHSEAVTRWKSELLAVLEPERWPQGSHDENRHSSNDDYDCIEPILTGLLEKGHPLVSCLVPITCQ